MPWTSTITPCRAYLLALLAVLRLMVLRNARHVAGLKFSTGAGSLESRTSTVPRWRTSTQLVRMLNREAAHLSVSIKASFQLCRFLRLCGLSRPVARVWARIAGLRV